MSPNGRMMIMSSNQHICGVPLAWSFAGCCRAVGSPTRSVDWSPAMNAFVHAVARRLSRCGGSSPSNCSTCRQGRRRSLPELAIVGLIGIKAGKRPVERVLSCPVPQAGNKCP